MVLGWRSRASAAAAESQSDPGGAAAPTTTSADGSDPDDTAVASPSSARGGGVEALDELVATSTIYDDTEGGGPDGPSSSLDSAGEICARNGTTDGGSGFGGDPGRPGQSSHDEEGSCACGESDDAPASKAASAPPLFASSVGGGGGGGGGGPASDVNRGGRQRPQSVVAGRNGPAGMWLPPPSSSSSSSSSSGVNEVSKKMKRDRSGNAAIGDGGGGSSSSSGGGNVTRIDVYPNGESYVTTPDGTVTKTMSTAPHITSSSSLHSSLPIFQFTSNTASACVGGMMGGGGTSPGGESASVGPAAIMPLAAAAALNFGKGFVPGIGTQGMTPLPPVSIDYQESVFSSASAGHSSPVSDAGESSSAAFAFNSDARDDDCDCDDGGDRPPSIHWQPQSQTSTCEFTHTIADYSQKRDSGCKKAEYSSITTDSHGNKWRLIIYVNGNGRASNHHLSLFLQVADAEELPFGWNKAVSYVLTLEHPQGQSLGYAKRNPDKTFKLCPKAIDWGWSQFITSDRIQQEGYVNKNALVVRASVTVKSSSVQIDPEDAELYLKCAVEEGNAEAVKVCLAQEARVNCQFKDDLYTPLHTACSANNHSDGNHGSSSSSSSSSSSTPTNSNSPAPGPISQGCLEVLDLLLERGADVNACNKWKETPLLIAANNGHVEAVKRLLESGANPSLCSEAGWSALTFAAHKGYDDICGLLLAAQASVDCRVTEDLSTPLHKACAGSKAGHISAVSQLLEGSADVHALNKWRETPLLTAANHGQSEAVEALLRYGADPCKCTDTGWSPLSIAAYKGHDEVVRLLLEEGAPTEEDDPTLSALLQAATKGLPDTVMLLLRHGADHTVTTKKGDTALSILVEQNLIDAAVEMVTDYSASIPRCSRDRKKVQRARLLINLRLKQMQRDGTGPYCDDSDHGDSDAEPENMGRALHDDADSAASPSSSDSKLKKKKQKGFQISIAKQEAEARAAEEALLLELAAEESAKSAAVIASEGGSSKNSKKKKKKKEKERQKAEQALDDEIVKEKETKAKKLSLVADAAMTTETDKDPSPMMKEKIIELTMQSIVQSQKQKKKHDSNNKSSPAKKASPIQEVIRPSPSPSTHNNKQHEESKLNLSWADSSKDAKPKKVREVLLPKAGEASLMKKPSSLTGNNNNAHHIKTTNVAKAQGHSAIKNIPGDSPVQPKKIPGDNPVAPRKIPGDVQPKKIPGDNPKVPIEHLRSQNTHQKGFGDTPLNSKRGWESKNSAQQPSSAPTVNKNQPSQQSKQSPEGHLNKEKSSGKKAVGNAPTIANKSPSDSDSPSFKGKHACSDESTHSTANSTADSLSATPTPGHKSATPGAFGSAETPMSSDAGPKAVVDDRLTNSANGILGPLDSDPSHLTRSVDVYSSITPPPTAQATLSSSTMASPAAPMIVSLVPVELPSVSIYRFEKVNEIFRICSRARSSAPINSLHVIDERTLRVVLYRWIIRASHGSEPFLDPVIPSWEDEAYLKEFLQRQFISESRRSVGEDSRYNMSCIPSIEVLRDAGAAMSEICMSLARAVIDFRSKCEQQVPSNWTDSDINMAGMEESGQVVIEWSRKSRLSIPSIMFNTLARRYVGDQSRLLSAIFSAVQRHEIMSAIASQTDMVCHLPLQTMECLTKGLSASLETWSDSLSVYGNNYFCAMFPDVDIAFGGLPPFGKQSGGGESVLYRAGGAVVVLLPPENATSSQCIRKMVDMSENYPNLPLSFGVILSSECFVNPNNMALSVTDLRALDPRLCGDKKNFISFIDVIPAGSSVYSKSSSMFLLIQNEAGQLRFPPHPTAMDIIRRSLRSDIGMSNASMMSNFQRIPGDGFYESAGKSSFSPIAQRQYAGAPQEAPLSSNPWGGVGRAGNRGGGGRGHRGRLFELVGDEDTDEDHDMNNILPGMLDSLNMNMFGGSNTNEEVDIEAISLMGIGLNGENMNGSYHSS